jgi:uncharacterized membrane protein (UPF0127 family)
METEITKKDNKGVLNKVMPDSTKQVLGIGLFSVVIILGLGSRVIDVFKNNNQEGKIEQVAIVPQTCEEKALKHFKDYPKQEFVLKDKKSGKESKYQVWIANTNDRRILGLSNTECLPKGTGLLFEFEKSEIQFFWMKDMKYPVDIIWLDDQKKEVGRAKNVLPESYPNTVNSSVPVKYVLEINPEK